MEINKFDLQCILDMGSDSIELSPESTQKLITELTRDQRFVDLVFEAYEKIKEV